MKYIKKFENFEEISDISVASEIIGKELDDKSAYQEITDFIEANIEDKSMEKEIDTLTNIKRKMKHL